MGLDIDKLIDGDMPIPFYALTPAMASYLTSLLCVENAEQFLACYKSKEWGWLRKATENANPLLPEIAEAIENGRGHGLRVKADGLIASLVKRTFIVKMDDRSLSDLGLRVGLGEVMRRRLVSGDGISYRGGDAGQEQECFYRLTEVDSICCGRRLPQLKSNSYRRGKEPIDSRWELEGRISRPDSSRVRVRIVTSPGDFPVLVPFPANRYPKARSAAGEWHPSGHPFSTNYAEYMRSQIENRGEHAILKQTPGGRSLAESQEAVLEVLSGFDYENRELLVWRPGRKEEERVALFGVVDSFNGLTLVGYLLDEIVENGRVLKGAKAMAADGHQPYWRAIPIREKDHLETTQEVAVGLDRYRLEQGALFSERDDWDADMIREVDAGRAIFRDRRLYMCEPSTDRILEVRIIIRPEGWSRFEGIRHSVQARRKVLYGLMPFWQPRSGISIGRNDVHFPRMEHCSDGSENLVYEDWVVGRRGFTRFLRQNMDVIDSVEARYVPDCCGRQQDDGPFNLEDYAPIKESRESQTDPYATGYRWSAYRILKRYEEIGCGVGVPLDNESHELLAGAGAVVGELGIYLNGGSRGV